MPILRAIDGPHAGQVFPLSGGSIEIGREADCGILLAQDGGLSRHHARLEVQPDRVLIHDLGSRNGVFVNGSRTASTIVWPGDQIKLGNTVFVLEADPIQPGAAPEPYPAAGAPIVPPSIPSGAPSAPSAAASVPPAGPTAPWQANAYPYAPAPGPGAYSTGMGAMPGIPPGAGFYGAYEAPKNAVPFARWLYFFAFSLPPIGLIFGLIYLLKETPEERNVGIWIMIWSVVGGIVGWLSWIALMGALHSLGSQSGQLSGLLGGGSTGGVGGLLK